MSTATKPPLIRARRLAGAFAEAAKPWTEEKTASTPPARLQAPVMEAIKLTGKQTDADALCLRAILIDFAGRAEAVTASLYDRLEADPDVKGVDPDDAKGHTWSAEEVAATRRVEAEWAAAPNSERDRLLADTPWVADAIRCWSEAEPVSWDGRRREVARAFLVADGLAAQVEAAKALAAEVTRFRDVDDLDAHRLRIRLETFSERGGGPEVLEPLRADVAAQVLDLDLAAA